MAAVDEEWLYGDPEVKKEKDGDEPAPGTDALSKLSASAEPFQPKDELATNGDVIVMAVTGDGDKSESGGDKAEANDGDEDDEEDDDDEDSDDDVQITIGDIKTQSSTYDKFKTGYQRPVGAAAVAAKQPAKGVDLDAVGTISGVPVFEFDIASLEEKPWRKPGADITDYFNYGFNEDTWQQYCEKQRRLRMENNVGIKIFNPNANDDRRQNRQNKPQNRGQFHNQGHRQPYMAQKRFTSPARSQPTTINVIGSHNTRRPAAQEFESQQFDASQTPPPPGVGTVSNVSPGAPQSSSFTVPVHMPPPITSNISLTSHPNTSSYAPTTGPPTSYAQPVTLHPPGVPPPQAIGVMAGPVHQVQVVSAGPMGVQPAPPGIVPRGPPPNMMMPPTHQRPPLMTGPPRGPMPGMTGPPPGPVGPPPGYGGPRPMPGMAPRGPPPGYQGPPGALQNQGMAPRGPPPGYQGPPGAGPHQGFQPYGPPQGNPNAPPPHRGPPPQFQGDRPPFGGPPQNAGPPPPRYSGPPTWEKETHTRNWMDLPMSDDDLSDDEARGNRRRDRNRDNSGRRRSRSRDRDRRDRDRRDDRHNRSSRR